MARRGRGDSLASDVVGHRIVDECEVSSPHHLSLMCPIDRAVEEDAAGKVNTGHAAASAEDMPGPGQPGDEKALLAGPCNGVASECGANATESRVERARKALLSKRQRVGRHAAIGWSVRNCGPVSDTTRGRAPRESKRRASDGVRRSAAAELLADRECNEILIIPDLERNESGDIVTQVADAPRNRMKRVPPLAELDRNLLRIVSSNDREIDLTPVAGTLIPTQLVAENEDCWDFDALLLEVTRDVIAIEHLDGAQRNMAVNAIAQGQAGVAT